MFRTRNRWTAAAVIVVICAVLAACQTQTSAPPAPDAGANVPTAIVPPTAAVLPPQAPAQAVPPGGGQQAGAPPPGTPPQAGGQNTQGQPPQGGQSQQGQPPQGGGQQGQPPQGGQAQQGGQTGGPPSGGQQGQQGGGQSGPGGGGQSGGSNYANNPETVSGLSSGASVDLHNLIIGTLITTSPQRGGLWSCQTTFTGGGASATGAWYHSDGTYDLLAKPFVDGSVTWPHEFTVLLESTQRMFTGNDLPDHATGTYPISQSDDAYQYDHNPNSISAQSFDFDLSSTPQLASSISCVGGQVGILLSGAYLFNAVDAGGRDAVATEIQDQCAGHPQSSGAYHYHGYTPCIDNSKTHHLIGYALDGFGIYGPYDVNGTYLTNADLDECHGHLHEIEWDGQMVVMYHYHANYEFPYSVGCFRGSAIHIDTGEGGQGGQQGGGQQGGGQQGGQQGGQSGGPPGGQSGGQGGPPGGQSGGQGGPPGGQSGGQGGPPGGQSGGQGGPPQPPQP